MNFPLYIGPSMGAGAIVLTLIIGGIVVASLGYIVWLRVKKFLKK
jgi:uncharacterized membrane protein YidH (DUF202 family)